MFKEFKEFMMRGNVLDLAVGIVIGAAFGKIVTSLVTDIVMPPIGRCDRQGGLLESLHRSIGTEHPTLAAAKAAGAATINYGLFLNT